MAVNETPALGAPELITGKRFQAHNGGDPDEDKPLGVYYYRLQKGARPERHGAPRARPG